ncbi:MAG: hypothetical protein AWT59_2761 [Candidatus Gallionella acididurans]|uniref:Uncharacterized protein n=1 Tax=Candidatus Gallionella acididurans TaxID=1796491 RepID=A0A139BQ99_9PROT|nr:MAG: hypothetical protein AWT59_2761 [Candidatus Gallionella acididurans]
MKQSSKTKMHFFNHLDCRVGFASAALRSRLKPCCKDEALWIPRIRGIDVPVFNFPLPHSARCVTVIKYGNLNKKGGSFK